MQNQCGEVKLNKLVSICDYHNPEWFSLHSDLEKYSFDKHCFFNTNGNNYYRKGWEWTQALYGLKQLNMLSNYKNALGVGAGRECVIFYLCDCLKSVVATDLYGNTKWNSIFGKESDPNFLKFPEKYCPKSFNKDHLKILNMDGTTLQFDDNSFDIVWSLSSIEHFGGHDAASKSINEMARVTKPNGVVVIATEYLLLSEYTHPEYFNKSDLYGYIVNANENLELIQDIDFSLPSPECLIDSIVFNSEGVQRLRRHIVLNDGKIQWTSIALFFRKIGN
jgi:SAM-dependent methyltransferase